MNVSGCLKSDLTENQHMFLIFERIIPYLVRGLLFGGIPPYLLHITRFKSDEFKKDGNKRVVADCENWIHDEFIYPNYVTDIIVYYQCPGGHEDALHKINRKMSLNASQLARPNMIVIFQLRGDILIPMGNCENFIQTIINVKYLQVGTGGAIRMVTQNVINGETRRIQISASEIVEPLSSTNDFGLDFKRKSLRVVTIPYKPYVIRAGSINGTLLYEGFAISVLDLLATQYNFTYTIEESAVFGSKLANGTWIGMVGQVSRQEKDLSVTGLTINAKRSTVVDFTYPFWLEPSGAVMHVKDNRFLYLFRPFTTMMWQAILVVFAITTICYMLVDYMTLKLHNIPRDSCLQNLKDITWYMIHVWLLQGHTSFFLGPLIPLFWTSGDFCPGFQSQGGSLACFLAWVIPRFTAGATPADCVEVLDILIETFRVQNSKLPLQSLDDLSKSEQYFPLVMFGTVHHTLLEMSRAGVYARIWKRIEEDKETNMCYGSIDNCLNEWLKSDHLVYISDKSNLQVTFIQESGCQAALVPEEMFPSGFGIAIPKGSPYKPFFDHVIETAAGTGILETFEKKYPATDDTCVRMKEEMRSTRALTLQEAAAAFVILGAGISMASIILFLELLFQGVQKALCISSASNLKSNLCVLEREPISSVFDLEPKLFSLEMESIRRVSSIEPTPETSEGALVDPSKREPMPPVATSPDNT